MCVIMYWVGVTTMMYSFNYIQCSYCATVFRNIESKAKKKKKIKKLSECLKIDNNLCPTI